jgi:RHS repeat-associated protein
VPPQNGNVDFTYSYDGGGGRVLEVLTPADDEVSISAQVFPSLRLDATSLDSSGDYVHSATTETVYLAGGAVNARLLYAPTGVPSATGSPLHVLLELGDHLSSTSVVIDRDTSELVERVTYQAYGATESDYRPPRWASFREQFRFAGTKDDLDVGLTYVDQRYYSAPLGRWVSADPLTVHGLGADVNAYRYVGNSPLAEIDPDGLDPVNNVPEPEDVTVHGDPRPLLPTVDCGYICLPSGSAVIIDLSVVRVFGTAKSGTGWYAPTHSNPLQGNPLGFLCGDGPCQFGNGRPMTPQEYSDEEEFAQIQADYRKEQQEREEFDESWTTDHYVPLPDPVAPVMHFAEDSIVFIVAGDQSVPPEPVEGAVSNAQRGASVRRNLAIFEIVFAVGAVILTKNPEAAETVTADGLATIQGHLARLGALDEPANAAMLGRLQAGERAVQDLNFYAHELYESNLMAGTDYGYDAARAAHLETLQWQGIPYAPGYESQLYHPDVISQFLEFFNPAAWPK